MRAPGQGVVKSVEEKSVVTVSAGHSTHPGNIGQRGRGGRRRGQVDDPLTVWSGAGDPLTSALTDEETVAGTPDILAAWRSIPDGCCLVTRVALDNMLIITIILVLGARNFKFFLVKCSWSLLLNFLPFYS